MVTNDRSSLVGQRVRLVDGLECTVLEVHPQDPPHAPQMLVQSDDGDKTWQSTTRISKTLSSLPDESNSSSGVKTSSDETDE